MRAAMLVIVTAMVLSACNTVAGVGQDIKGAGEVLEQGAKKTKRAISN